MGTKVGIWMDHQQAILVFLEADRERVLRLESGATAHPHSIGGSRTSSAYGPQDVVAEDKLDHEFRMAMDQFYQSVAAALESAEAVYLFGPGQAKKEFRNQLAADPRLADRVKAVEAAQQLSEADVIRQVKRFFSVRPIK